MNQNYYPGYLENGQMTNMNGYQPNNNFYPQAIEGTYPQDERFFLAPFVVGGLAGTALGYGIANNNQINNKGGCCMQPMMYYPQPMPQQIPYMYSNNNFYY